MNPNDTSNPESELLTAIANLPFSFLRDIGRSLAEYRAGRLEGDLWAIVGLATAMEFTFLDVLDVYDSLCSQIEWHGRQIGILDADESIPGGAQGKIMDWLTGCVGLLAPVACEVSTAEVLRRLKSACDPRPTIEREPPTPRADDLTLTARRALDFVPYAPDGIRRDALAHKVDVTSVHLGKVIVPQLKRFGVVMTRGIGYQRPKPTM